MRGSYGGWTDPGTRFGRRSDPIHNIYSRSRNCPRDGFVADVFSYQSLLGHTPLWQGRCPPTYDTWARRQGLKENDFALVATEDRAVEHRRLVLHGGETLAGGNSTGASAKAFYPPVHRWLMPCRRSFTVIFYSEASIKFPIPNKWQSRIVRRSTIYRRNQPCVVLEKYFFLSPATHESAQDGLVSRSARASAD